MSATRSPTISKGGYRVSCERWAVTVCNRRLISGAGKSDVRRAHSGPRSRNGERHRVLMNITHNERRATTSRWAELDAEPCGQAPVSGRGCRGRWRPSGRRRRPGWALTYRLQGGEPFVAADGHEQGSADVLVAEVGEP